MIRRTGVFLAKCVKSLGTLNSGAEFLQLDGLGEKVESTLFHGLNGAVDISICGYENDFDIGGQFAGLMSAL